MNYRMLDAIRIIVRAEQTRDLTTREEIELANLIETFNAEEKVRIRRVLEALQIDSLPRNLYYDYRTQKYIEN